MATPRRRTDAASKLLFLADVIADLIRIALPALARELDLDGIEPRPTEFIHRDRSKRIGDAAYRIPFVEREGGPVRIAIASAEFQDENDHAMLARVRGYTDRMLADYRRRGLIGEDEHPLVLPFVIHTGAGRWSAADGGEPLADASAEIVREVALYQPQAYIPVDIGGRVALPSGAPDNRFLAAARLVRSRTVPALAEQLRSEWRLFATPGYRRFREGMHAWVEEALLGAAESGAELPSFEEMDPAVRRTGGRSPRGCVGRQTERGHALRDKRPHPRLPNCRRVRRPVAGSSALNIGFLNRSSVHYRRIAAESGARLPSFEEME